MVSYEQRLNKIKTVNDIDTQLRLAKQYVQRLRRESKAMPTLQLKLKKLSEQKQAEVVVRKLRQNSFDLEGSLRQQASVAA